MFTYFSKEVGLTWIQYFHPYQYFDHRQRHFATPDAMLTDHVHVIDLLDCQRQLNHCNHYDDLCMEIHVTIASSFRRELKRKSFVINQKEWNWFFFLTKEIRVKFAVNEFLFIEYCVHSSDIHVHPFSCVFFIAFEARSSSPS